MAIDFSKLNFFSRLDARARVLVLLGGVIGFILIIYLGTLFLSGGSATTGTSRVATVPAGLQSVPGAQLTPEYQRTLEQSNIQSAQQAQLSGGSAVPTVINPGSAQGGCVICSDQSTNIKDSLERWATQGKVSQDVVSRLEDMAARNVPVSEFASELDRLVKAGKLTPAQARELLDQYRKQHLNRLLQDSGKLMDTMIQNGTLPLNAANALLASQKNGASPSDYAAQLQALMAQNKISPATAQQLLAQYTEQRAKEIVAQSIASLRDMESTGQITPDVAKTLVDLENRMVPFDTYAATLEKMIAAGKITPVVARSILDEYNAQKMAIGPAGSLNGLIKKAEEEAYQEISDLLKAGTITQDTASQLTTMIQQNIPFADFQAAIAQMVQQKKLTPEIAQLKLADYKKVKDLRDLSQRLAALQGNNAPPSNYADELKRAVQAGILSPEDAARLMQEYEALRASQNVPVPTSASSEDFAKLQQRLAQGAPTTTVATAGDFAAAKASAAPETVPAESDQDRLSRIQGLMSAMSGQAQQLVSAWEPQVMRHVGNSGQDQTTTTTKTTTQKITTAGQGGAGAMGGVGRPIIKAGTILFAVLDSAVNSDYPDSPVLATIVTGPLKGAKLLGKLTTAKSVAGQLDRIALNFTLMNLDMWPTSKNVTAYAIDPDTARTVMASSVDYHYLKRFGAIMATSFLQGYATSITNAGTATTGIFGTSTTHPTLNPTSKIMVGLGQVGQTLGAATQNWINIPPTVRVDSGVGLGILFMSDVS